MPRIANVNLVAVLLGAVAFYFVGFLWYAVLFQQPWLLEQVVIGGVLSREEASAMDVAGMMAAWTEAYPNANPALAMGVGFLSTIVMVFVLALVLRAFNARGVVGSIKCAVLVWFGFVLTALAYGQIYGQETLMLLAIDGSHTLVGYSAAAAVLSFFD